ncbi:hypothetical protein ACFVUH_25865 [Kitasatospora sp. NPDC058032]|uniref:hypothetical protein n=1 Tax=Kitasatospora sp. NPDC058032 TaxID=3346307 RepID=UPI0036DD35FC
MALHCELCGSRTDGAERLGRYCPGEYCGTDLRAGPDAGVRAWCEPPRRFGTAGGTVLLDLLVHNAGPQPTGFRIDPVEPVRGRLDFDRRAVEEPLPSSATRRIELRYTVPFDLVGLGPDIASRFGVPGAGAAGQVQGTPHARVGVALRVSALPERLGAACAAFAVDVPERPAPPGRPAHPERTGAAATGRARAGTGSRSNTGEPHGEQPPGRRTGGCGALALAVLVAVVSGLVALVLLLGERPGTASPRPDAAAVGPRAAAPARTPGIVDAHRLVTHRQLHRGHPRMRHVGGRCFHTGHV